MPSFQIESYKVSITLERFSTGTRRERMLELIGPTLYHGITQRASFAFSTAFDADIWGAPVVGFADNSGYSFTIVGWFPVAEFSYYYDIVRNERPVNVIYEFRDTGATSGYLSRLGLGTSMERVGEGPSDSTESIPAMMAVSDLGRSGRFTIPMPTLKDLSGKDK